MTETSTSTPQISVIIPARNEESNLATCLESLIPQTGINFEIIVVNDHSTDRTAEIARSFPSVRVIEAGPLPPGWTGKNNAVATGARAARGEWLLFTDADTVHLPGSLARCLKEAQENRADLLSYSPEQIAFTFWEMAILPVVFAELARQYPPAKVSDPASPSAAANGQYLLIRREVHDAVGGHAAVASNILEDVALARAVKTSGHKIRFRYAADAVRTRMYRNFRQLCEGWTKNLALLFPNPGWLAAKTLLLWVSLWAVIAIVNAFGSTRWWNGIDVAVFVFLVLRLRTSNFRSDGLINGVLFGMPMFAYLLLRSKRAHARGHVSWKGRTYDGKESSETKSKTFPARKTLMKTPLILLLPLFFLTALPTDARPTQISEIGPRFTTTTIEPGLSVGPLKLGETRDHALELFPKKAEDQEWNDPCGSTLDWVDTSNPNGRGDVYIRVKKDKIFQIESATTRFTTSEGITVFDSPEKVASAYKDMRAWVLLTAPVAALGDRPLVFWIDRKRGIAFIFAYDPSRHKRYVYKVVVFEPNKDICPELEKTSSPKWQAIRPYAVEPPMELSPEAQ
jgi:glycosyltransferase involved in cell wall biosynthesis